MKHIPLRFQATCHFCGDPVDTRQKNQVYSLQMGWMKNRSQGGGNALALRQPVTPLAWACAFCIDSRQLGTVGQTRLFA
jgi:hypothetical protein